MEKTFVLLKPDAVELMLENEIVRRFAEKRLVVFVRKYIQLTPEMLAEHYPDRVQKPYFPRLCEYMMRTPCIAMIVGGYDAVKLVRGIAGATDPNKADPNSIRARFGMTSEGIFENVLHSSASLEEAQIEIARFFGPRAPPSL